MKKKQKPVEEGYGKKSGGKMEKPERRKQQRFNFCCCVKGLEEYSGYIQNISMSGCLLKTYSEIDNKTLDIAFDLPHPPKTINAKGEVVWEKKSHLGIKFDMDDENREIHSQFINDLTKTNFQERGRT